MQNYDRLAEPGPAHQNPTRARFCLRILALLGVALLIVGAACGVLVAVRRSRATGARPGQRGPTRAIRKACGLTLYPDLCLESLVSFPGAMAAGGSRELARISVNLTMERVGLAVSGLTEIRNWEMDSMSRSAYEDCVELMEDSVELLARSLFSVSTASVEEDQEQSSLSNGGNQVGSQEDVITWLSGAMTNHDTCRDGLTHIGGTMKDQMVQRFQNLLELVSNSLAIYKATSAATPIENRSRRLLGSGSEPESVSPGFPAWISRADRKLLDTPTQTIQADIIVAQDGSGTVKTIKEAIKKAPEHSLRRIIIHVKPGTYAEDNLKVGRKKTNLWFLGEGKGRTIITGNKSVGRDNITTFHTATFAATGMGFLVRDITFVNEAGPGNHQAVALRVGADHAVVYRCEVKGYQDTLYVHSQRQFYRECDIYGTVDFICGNAAVVFQNCTMWARKPMPQQKVTITAQNRKDPNQNTGMSIHACQARPTSDLIAAQLGYSTYLGRPWKMYSRVVYMESYMGDHIDPKGWLEWNATSPLDKLYYGEYGNFGPRADMSQRVNWPGLHLNMSKGVAEKFTVAQFIFGQGWITSTGVAYQAGLST